MCRLQLTLLVAAAAGTMATSEDMGPAAVMWPPDREWSADADNTPPCGHVGGITNRTEFPLSGGQIALVAQDDSYSVQLGISISNDPQSQDDFEIVADSAPIPELDPGHTCFGISDPPSNVLPGTNATIQIQYTADFDKPENQTFYACADITYVLPEDFSARVPCFNATDPEDVPAPTATGTPTDLPGHGEEGPPLTTIGPSTDESDSGSNKLSGGAIAGIVVGSVAGVVLVAGLMFWLYREREQKKRLERQRDSPRGIKSIELSDRSI